eukprot:CAMPEP_0172006838 /NCGR_PEP_ID=MMETSP1041-20130122/5771_1 /TAXON_ID=464988 /ORGANISM="Hemiselmis andersenii, Strain CCMP439" /LENGTH=237 /DNA_ID=CAMNT_0012660881 /DNA_START=14 /DNA_END=724 /DNA_ORIENTATION=+
MDYEEEQANEVEALESIYFGHFEKLSDGPPWKFRVAVDPEAAEEREGDSAEPVRLEVTFPPTYPDVVPEIVVKYSHILPKHAEALTRHVNAEAENLLGQVMVFMLVTAAKEWLETNDLSTAKDWGTGEEEESLDEAAVRNRAGILKGIVGVTPVTEESFLKWRAVFEAKVAAADVTMTAERKEQLTRPTGRQLFERDASLYLDTDVGYNDAELFADEELPSDDDDDDDDDDEEDEDE